MVALEGLSHLAQPSAQAMQMVSDIATKDAYSFVSPDDPDKQTYPVRAVAAATLQAWGHPVATDDTP
jgi:hypothetical protein